ncbi:MAG: cob(I)yrinic acid a,c-diamide adenosyltransferase [Candidatus Kapaibacteriales bacterium]
MKIYTKTGDKGTTGLFNGARVSKDNLRVETYGTVDELNSVIGIARVDCENETLGKDLLKISNWLFNLGSDFATPLEPAPKWEVQRVNEENIVWLEQRMDYYEKDLPELKSFILPGGNKLSAHLHHARTVCRRAERLAVSLSAHEKLTTESVIFLNRLSDYFFMAARYANHCLGHDDILWDKEV